MPRIHTLRSAPSAPSPAIQQAQAKQQRLQAIVENFERFASWKNLAGALTGSLVTLVLGGPVAFGISIAVIAGVFIIAKLAHLALVHMHNQSVHELNQLQSRRA